MTATRSLAFTTTEWVINRVHSDAAGLRADALPAVTTCLTNREELKLCVTNLADGGSRICRNPSHLSRRKPQRSIYLVATYELNTHTRTSGYLASLAWAQLYIVDYGADWYRTQRQSITNRDIGPNSGLDLIADLQPTRGEDISLLTVVVVQ
jgi:hypothetical protein